MMNNLLTKVFREIGLSLKHARVYDGLVDHRAMSPLTLSRHTRINRTSLYRYLEDLRTAGLVEHVLSEHSTLYRATPEALNHYLTREEARLDTLKTTIPHLVKELNSRVYNEKRPSEVLYYQGREGLRNMLWKMVSSGKDYVGLGYEDWNTSVGRAYAEKLRQLHIEKGALSRELQNDDGNYTYTKFAQDYTGVYKNRVIDSTVLEIKHDTYIYGDVFAYTYHSGGELFGVEIHNPDIARTERQIFEILWNIAKPVG